MRTVCTDLSERFCLTAHDQFKIVTRRAIGLFVIYDADVPGWNLLFASYSNIKELRMLIFYLIML